MIVDAVVKSLVGEITQSVLGDTGSSGGGASAFSVLDSDGNAFSAPLNVLDSDGNSFSVSSSVLNSSGTSYSPI